MSHAPRTPGINIGLVNNIIGAMSLIFVTYWAASASTDITPTDLRLQTIEIVNSRDRRDLYWHNFPLPGSRSVIMINFESAHDIRSISQYGEFTVGYTASMCGKPALDKSTILRGDPTVYDANGHIDPSDDDGNSYRRIKQKENRTYHIYVDSQFQRLGSLDWNGEIPFNYDLRNASENICFKIHGNNARGDSWDSNIVSVPRGLVVAKMKELPGSVSGQAQ